MVVAGGGGFSREAWWSFERRVHENCVFHAEEHIYNS